MKTSQNTILITGGSAGIGFEIAKLLSENSNHVIIVGRNVQRLEQAASRLQNVTTIAADVSKEKEIDRLTEQLISGFPGLNIIINNAAKGFAYTLSAGSDSFDKAGEEMLTNYLSVVRLTEKLLPLLQRQTEAAIVNVSSIVAFIPSHKTPTYAASKAALHSYSQTLRFAMANTPVKVFELMPPLVNTEFSKEIGGEKGIAPSIVAEELLRALENDEYEIHVGLTEDLYKLSLSSPAEAFNVLNPAN
jgi:uncharacterized oxidoreductase